MKILAILLVLFTCISLATNAPTAEPAKTMPTISVVELPPDAYALPQGLQISGAAWVTEALEPSSNPDAPFALLFFHITVTAPDGTTAISLDGPTVLPVDAKGPATTDPFTIPLDDKDGTTKSLEVIFSLEKGMTWGEAASHSGMKIQVTEL